MADYSKQWCDLYDSDMPYDFDILEEFEKLPKNHYISIICEGFGFIAIMRDHEDRCLLAFDDSSVDEKIIWEDYDQFMNKTIELK
jgi:hypothetical protein